MPTKTMYSLKAQCLLRIVSVLAFFLLAFAAESGGMPDKHCPVKSYEGSYSYDPTSYNGPEKWGSIAGEDYRTCGKGKHQSPIDFPEKVAYAPLASGPIVNIGSATMIPSSGSYNWALNCDNCGSLKFRGKTYRLANVHFHSPSEHRLNGTSYPLEVHMVHAAKDGSLAVISTMFGYLENNYAAKVAAAGSVEYGESAVLKHAFKSVRSGSDTIPLGSIIDTKKGFCSYTGSLTTPPCSEKVTWFLSEHIATVSKRQVADYRLSAGIGLDGNNRPVQPLNGRKVTCYIK